VQFLRTLLKGLAYVPQVVITEKLASDGAALREILPSVEHHRHKGLHNRAEHAHQPTRERRVRRFKDPGHAQRFLAAYGPIIPMPAPGPLYQARAPLPVPTAIPPDVSIRAEHGPRRRSRTAGATGGALGRGASSASGSPRAAPPHPSCERTGGSATARARRGARHGLRERRAPRPQSAGGGRRNGRRASP